MGKPSPRDAELGEVWFYQTFVQGDGGAIFDVGTRDSSNYTSFVGVVHYFEPVPEFLGALSRVVTNPGHVLNPFGLSDRDERITYYPHVESFYDRRRTLTRRWIKSMFKRGHVRRLEVRRGDEYCSALGVASIDFLKVDTEGYEVRVLRGLGNHLATVSLIQFEYGGAWRDAGERLAEALDMLRHAGFTHFYYLDANSLVPIEGDADDYEYCNIVAARRDLNNDFRTHPTLS